MKVYFISGMAADRSMFKHIRLPEGCTEVHLDWIDALQKETLEHYAWRMAQSIDHSEPFAVIGLSLGGMLAAEIAKQFHPKTTILISSIPCHRHLPSYYKIIGKLNVHKAVPIALLKRAALMKRKFTSEQSADKKLLSEAIRSSDPAFIRWGMEAVLKWKTTEPPDNYVHIHGTRDEILPIIFTKPTHTVKGGGHLMVFTRARVINKILSEVLSS
ncbi:MAG: alpha/beta hydrolase [Flavitalea sp.]